MRVFSRRSDGLLNAVATTDPVTVTVPEDAIPATVNVPALAVIDPSATSEVLAVIATVVIANVLAIPCTVSVPALAVMDPSATIEVLVVIATVVIADVLAIP